MFPNHDTQLFIVDQDFSLSIISHNSLQSWALWRIVSSLVIYITDRGQVWNKTPRSIAPGAALFLTLYAALQRL